MRTSPPAVLLLAAAAAASYIPPYYEGTPEFVGVAGLDPPDYRGEEAYRLVLQKVPSEDSYSRRRPLLGPSPG